MDGVAWRRLRLRVLAEQPVCAVRGCPRPSTQVDHIVPLARGGAPLDRDNLQGMCGPHNASKGARMPVHRTPAPATTPATYDRPCFDCGSVECPGRWHL